MPPYGYALYMRENMAKNEPTLYMVEQDIVDARQEHNAYMRKTYWYPLGLTPAELLAKHGSLPIGAMITAVPRKGEKDRFDFWLTGATELPFLYGDAGMSEFSIFEYFREEQLENGRLTGVPFNRVTRYRLNNEKIQHRLTDFIITPVLDWVTLSDDDGEEKEEKL